MAEQAVETGLKGGVADSTVAEVFADDGAIFLLDVGVAVLMSGEGAAKVGVRPFPVEVTVDDGIEEFCEVAVNGVPYSDLNNAMRINVGLDVIRTLSEYYKFNAPVFVDNAESVTDLLPMPEHQVIRLVVNPEAKKLLVMTAEEAAKVKAELVKDPEGALTRMHGYGINL